MTKMKKLLISSIVLGVLALSSIGTTFAYFVKSINDSFNASSNITNEDVILVSSFSELYYASVNDKANDYHEATTSRKVIRLNADVTLLNNVIISRDAHIDLNGHKLKLNGFELVIKHGYYGAFDISNGSIYPENAKGESGRIVIDTPNASIINDNLTFKKNNDTEIADTSSLINVSNIESRYTAYQAMYSIAQALGNDLQRNNEMISYQDFIDNNVEINSSSLFFNSRVCSVSSLLETCFFVFDDLDLPNHFLSDKINITYSSTNTSLVSNLGDVTIPSTIDSAILTATISSSLFSTSYSCSFNLHVVNKESHTTINSLGGELIKSYLNVYYKNADVVAGTNTHHGYFHLSTGIVLPKHSNDFGIDFTYAPYEDSACTKLVTTNSIDSDDAYYFEPNQSCYYLKVSYSGGNSVVLNTYSTYISSYESVARSILNALYGGSFVYDSTSDNHTLSLWSDISTDARFTDLISLFNITNVTYSLPTTSEAYADYTIYNNGATKSIELTKDKPTKNKESALRVRFTISGTTLDIDMYIIYVSSGGDTINSFLTYYSIFTSMVPTNPTLEEFEMPMSYNNGVPYIAYDVAYGFTKSEEGGITTYGSVTKAMPESLKVSIVDASGNEITELTYGSNTSLTQSFDAYLTSNNFKKNELASVDEFLKTYPNAKWKFSFDKTKIDNQDMDVLLIYNYKFSSVGTWLEFNKVSDDGSTSLNDSTTSIFTINGGLYFDSSSTSPNAIRDNKLFIYLYNKLNTYGDTIGTISDLTQYAILNDWLDSCSEFDVNKASLTSTTDFNGIQYLTNCKVINISGINVSSTETIIDSTSYSVLELISELNNVEELYASNCSINFDYDEVSSSNKSISSIIALKDKLRILDISLNTIDKFDFLSTFDSLNEVYLYSNVSDIEALQSFYGSKGMCNFQAYEDLYRKGIKVYYEMNINNALLVFGNGDAVPAKELSDYSRLKNIEYQSSLSKSLSIELLYSKIKSLTPSNFSLAYKTNGTLTWSYEEGASVYEASYFQVTDTFTSNGYTITMVIKYYVDRY